MNPTQIEYTDFSWNPVTGCGRELPCWDYCWARRMAARQAGRNGYDDIQPFRPTFHRDRLDDPLRHRTPRRIAVCFMGDLWHPEVSREDRAAVIRATNMAPQHTYLFLTKRISAAADEIDWRGSPNLWIGTSCDDQATYLARKPHLLRCNAVRRWLSIEPMSGPIRLGLLAGIDWIVMGGGPFPVHPDWVRSIRDRSQEAGVPFFFKQWGRYAPVYQFGDFRDWVDAHSWFSGHKKALCIDRFGHRCLDARDIQNARYDGKFPVAMLDPVGKKAAGRLLDGREWSEIPDQETKEEVAR